MKTGVNSCQLTLIGAFRLNNADGARIDISSRRGQALLAMLATSGSGERTRNWLQDRLWGSRGPEQAQASLRRELSNLRKIINTQGAELLHADFSRVWINLEQVEIDTRKLDQSITGEFLEGLDLAGEEGFEDWLREERQRQEKRVPLKPVTNLAAELVKKASPLVAAEFAIRPVIAVMPFNSNITSSQEAAIVQGLSEDLIDRLSKLRWLPVIARSSCFALAGKGLDAVAAGAALGARYIVEGMLRDSNAGRQLAASLTDAETGQTIWSNRTAMPPEGDFGAFDDMLDAIAAAVGLKVDRNEQERALTKTQSDLNVSELIWRGRWHLNRLGQGDIEIARNCFDEALRREPNSPEAIIQSAWVTMWGLWLKRGTREEISAARKQAQRAIMADHDDARGHMLAGIAEIWLQQPLRAEALLIRAIDLNPSLVLAHSELGSALYCKGDPQQAISFLNFAIRLSPNDFTLFYSYGELAIAHLMLGNFDAAVEFADKSIMLRSAYWHGHVTKINALARSGKIDLARSAFADLQNSNIGFNESFIDWLPFVDSNWNDFLKDGLNLIEGCID